MRSYMSNLEIPDILNEAYEAPMDNTPERVIFKAQDAIMSSFLLATTDQEYLHLLQNHHTAKNRYHALREYLDLKTHAQRYYTVKKIITHKFTLSQSTAAAVAFF